MRPKQSRKVGFKVSLSKHLRCWWKQITIVTILVIFLSEICLPTITKSIPTPVALSPVQAQTPTPTSEETLPSNPLTAPTKKSYTIGVVAKRGKEIDYAKWQPTADYLTQKLPGYTFEVVPLNFEELEPAVKEGKVDFMALNPGAYANFEALYGVNRLATIKNLRLGKPYTVFGGVIFVKADRSDIQKLQDLKGKTAAGVDESAFGGWQIQWRELKQAKVNPYRDFKKIDFVGTHDDVVYAVQKGEADVGMVRTDTIERMAKEGKIKQNEFKIINQQTANQETFPFAVSTSLYPEWPFAVGKQVSAEVSEQVAIALLQMPKDSPAAKAAKAEGWTIPLNYQPVHDVMIELGIGAYAHLGKVTFGQVLRKFWYVIVILVGFIVFGIITIYFQRRHLAQQRAMEVSLKRFNEELDQNFREKAAALESEQRKNQTLQEILAQMDELQASSKEVSEQALTVDSLAQKVMGLVNRGTNSVEETVTSMNSLKTNVNEMAGQTNRLNENMLQIRTIINLVDGLAKQTNMLALNASVEAARAGKHGQGFAVVASEIRQLADQSRESAHKISGLIAEIQKTIQTTTGTTQEGVTTVDSGVKIVQATSDAFGGVQKAIDEVVFSAQQISLSTQQQATAVNQVVAAIHSVRQENRN